MSNSLKELAQEYKHSIDLLSSCIPDIRAEYRQATHEGNKEKMKILAKKLCAVMQKYLTPMRPCSIMTWCQWKPLDRR